jgi:hypothetical protein
MKRLFVAFVIACRCYAGDSTEIRTVVRDSPQRDTSGQPIAHLEETFRGKERILLTMRSIKGGVTSTTRTFIVGGVEVFVESDEDGNGRFDTIVAINEAKGGLEVFKRQPDGSVKPADEKTVAAFKRQFGAIAGFWDQMLGKDAPSDKFLESAKALKKELQEAEKQKTQDKK